MLYKKQSDQTTKAIDKVESQLSQKYAKTGEKQTSKSQSEKEKLLGASWAPEVL